MLAGLGTGNALPSTTPRRFISEYIDTRYRARISLHFSLPLSIIQGKGLNGTSEWEKRLTLEVLEKKS
jgi:hypothetical protein